MATEAPNSSAPQPSSPPTPPPMCVPDQGRGKRKPTVKTCQGLSEDDPWHLSYLAVLGDVSPYPHRQNTWNDLRPDLTFQDVLTICGVDGDGSASGLLTLLRDFSAVSAIELSRSKLTGGLQVSYNKGLSESSRFEWGDDGKAHQYGPNIVVVYQPGSVEDLALIWNLRARFLHPPRFPLAIPMTPAAGDDLRFLLGAGADHHFGFGHNLALTSFSVPRAELAALDRSGPDGTFADLVIHVAAHEGLDLAGTQELIDHLVAAQDEVRRLTQD